MKVSVIVLTWNRKLSVEKSLPINIDDAGYPIHELIHVDNGSSQEFFDFFNLVFEPTTQIRHKENVGIYRGWNSGMAMATGTHVVLLDCDIIMPKNWLAHYVTAAEKIPETGIVTLFHRDPHLPNMSREGRMTGPEQIVNGVKIRPCVAAGVKMFSRDLMFKAGFWREDFGLYGMGDLEYSGRLMRVAKEQNLLCYTLPDLPFCEHIPDHDFEEKINGKTYREFKTQYQGEWKQKLVNHCRDRNYPYYNPFNKIEVDLREKLKCNKT